MRQAALDDLEKSAPSLAGDAKLALLGELLQRRRDYPDLFAEGTYEPVALLGPRAGNVLAFRRSLEADSVTCVLALRCTDALLGHGCCVSDPQWWQDTSIEDGTLLAGLIDRGPVFKA